MGNASRAVPKKCGLLQAPILLRERHSAAKALRAKALRGWRWHAASSAGEGPARVLIRRHRLAEIPQLVKNS